MKKPICIIAGVGNSTGPLDPVRPRRSCSHARAGTGAACAREFKDHRVAVLGRRAESLNQLVKEINEQGGEALAVPVSEYARGPLENAFETVRSAFCLLPSTRQAHDQQVAEKWPDSQLKLAIWNTSQWSRIPFLDVTEAVRLLHLCICISHCAGRAKERRHQHVRLLPALSITSSRSHSLAAFAFSQSAVRAMLKHSQGGSLLVTGATSATRGAAAFSVFAAGKHASRAMTQVSSWVLSGLEEVGEALTEHCEGIWTAGHSCALGLHRPGVLTRHRPATSSSTVSYIPLLLLTRPRLSVVTGTIATDATRRNFGSRADKDEGWLDDRTQSLSPVSIAKVRLLILRDLPLCVPLSCAQTYRWLHEQRQDCWTHELDLCVAVQVSLIRRLTERRRPSKEHF